MSLGDAVKLAVDGNLQIPGSVILVLKNYYKVICVVGCLSTFSLVHVAQCWIFNFQNVGSSSVGHGSKRFGN